MIGVFPWLLVAWAFCSQAAPGPAGDPNRQFQSVRALLRDGRFADAEPIARAMCAERPEDPRAAFYLGLVLHKAHRYSEALPLLERAAAAPASAFAEAPHAVHYLGWCRYYLGQLPAAEEAFKRHAVAFPEYDDTQFALGLIAYDEDRLPEAEARFRQALLLLARRPDAGRERAKNLARLGDVQLRLGRLDDAEASYREAASLHPGLAEHWSKLARVLDRKGDAAGAGAARARAASIEAAASGARTP